MDEIAKILNDNNNFPQVQEIAPVNAQLGFTLIMTPQLSSGLPTTPISITDALIAEVIKANPMVTNNFTYVFGMGASFIPMPAVGRNMYNLSASIQNCIPSFASIYSYIMLMSNANSLILCRTELEGGGVVNPQKLVMRNSAVYERPAFLGITAGAVEAQQIVEQMSVMGSIDFVNTSLGDGLQNIVLTLGGALNIIQQAGNIVNP